jgi:hypothetical protein
MDYKESLKEYESRVRSAFQSLGPASFQVIVDEVAPNHMISHHAIENIILPELKKNRDANR